MQGTLLVGTSEDGFCSIADVDGDDLTGAFGMTYSCSCQHHSVLTAIFPGEPGLASCPRNSSPFIPGLCILLGQT